jgi:hypothetical protein
MMKASLWFDVEEIYFYIFENRLATHAMSHISAKRILNQP